MMPKTYKNVSQKGFTLIEIMVSLSVFIVIMTVSLGSILSILEANDKSQTKKTAMDNLNFALESMSRTVRFSTNYYCGTTSTNPPPAVDCDFGGSSLSVRSPDGSLIVYSLSGGRLIKTVTVAGVAGVASPVTSSEVTINRLTFYVLYSAPPPDLRQPRVLLILSGTVGTKTSTQSVFNLQTLMSQRKIDI
jgi:prepilin-type N-terminal cleavage/methylation domain-containing protein